ncbi:BamA/TamA family outer membrane protein [Akkermansiaceae bacterium]|nr:BamA/TamA family outer membrane protein [Akkermansiaceae bacterium]
MRRFLQAMAVAHALALSAVGETEIDIQGMKSKSQSDVLRLMAGRLAYVRSKPATSWRAADAAFLVTEALRNDGFRAVKVTPRIEGSGRIVLTVDEGLRFSLGKVQITGDEDAESLAELFSVPAKRNESFGTGTPPFREEDLETGLSYVSQQLMAQGYWDAQAVLLKQDADSETGEVDITVAVDRGSRFRIGRPTVFSPDGRGVKRAATTWEPYIGRWASTENVNGLRAAMIEAFNSRGYPDADIRMERRLEGDRFYPEFEIRLGTRVRLLEIHSEGLERTSGRRVKQIMKSLEGEWYDEAAMNGKIRDLLGTGAFDSVRLETNEVARKRIDATLHFEEARAKEFSLAAGAGSFNGPLLRAGYADRNFHGELRGLSAGLELSGRGVLGELRLTNPWWRGTDVTSHQRLFSLIRGFDGYTTIETGVEAGWSWDVTEHYAMDLLLAYSFVTVSEKGLPPALLGETDYSHLRIAFTQKWDFRDNKVLPKDGWHLSIPIQIGAAVGDGAEPYSRFGLQGGWHHPLGKTYQLGIGGFANWVSPSGDIRDLPVDLRVFNGGARSVRSFPERELGPSFGGDPYGGDFSWAVNTELSRSIGGPATLVAFMDAGAVTGNYTGIREGGLEIAAGLGIRFDLPIGPVRLEYGHNLTKDAAEPGGTWHFAIGGTF